MHHDLLLNRLRDEPARTLLLLAEDGRDERAVIAPTHVRQLRAETPVTVYVERSATRCFSDDAYAAAGAVLVTSEPGTSLRWRTAEGEIVSEPQVVLSTKRPERLIPGAIQCAFYHVHKGQDPAFWQRMLDTEAQNSTGQKTVHLDYELMCDQHGRRVVGFGSWAGRVGMLNTLAALGRLAPESPFAGLHRAADYDGYGHVRRDLERVADRLRRRPPQRPWVIALTGGGAVSRGALEVMEALEISGQLHRETGGAFMERIDRHETLSPGVWLVTFRRKDRYGRTDDANAPFDAEHFANAPHLYRSRMAAAVPHLDALINGIFWAPEHPRLLSAEALATARRHFVIGDITCDRAGSLPTPQTTLDSDKPFLVWSKSAQRAVRWSGLDAPDVLAADELAILAHDRLPRELPQDATLDFADAFLAYLRCLLSADARFDVLQDTLTRSHLTFAGTPQPEVDQQARHAPAA